MCSGKRGNNIEVTLIVELTLLHYHGTQNPLKCGNIDEVRNVQ